MTLFFNLLYIKREKELLIYTYLKSWFTYLSHICGSSRAAVHQEQQASSTQMEEVRNQQIILQNYVNGFPKESDMLLITSSAINLNLPEASNAVLLKTLYLSCDPYMRGRMSKSQGSYFDSFTPGSPIGGLGVAKVVDSTHSNFKKGDLVWGGIR
ncbi:putative oxidoreductase [Helianthus annuus]|nr:putative oxidoreductase [Helianthus annuus]KAJ0793407.1 putative oxidoreductase [Helianthus annuus]